jgi:hypothetical protein
MFCILNRISTPSALPQESRYKSSALCRGPGILREKFHYDDHIFSWFLASITAATRSFLVQRRNP